jgi:glycosyltransferase involved in cell wall biosynthesis
VRIATVGPAWPFRGGIAHYATLLARNLRVRHDVLFVSLVRGYPRWLFPGRTDRDPSVQRLVEPSERLLAPLLPWTWWRTARRIAAYGPDAVIIQWWSPFWAPSLGLIAGLAHRWASAPIVFVCHNVLPHEGGGAAIRFLTRVALGRAQGYIVHSDSDAAALAALLGRAGADAARIRRTALPALTIAAPVDRAVARAALGVAADASVALFFGFVRPYKGLVHLIDALPLALPQVPRLRLIVAGECWGSSEPYAARAAACGVADRVRFDDHYIPNEDVGHYFAAADVVVLPYVQASQTGVVTQASEAGVPAIVTRVGGLPETVDDGNSGLVVAPGDPVALAGALARVLGDPAFAARLRAGVAVARDRFAWSGVVTVIEELVAATTPRPGSADAGARGEAGPTG